MDLVELTLKQNEAHGIIVAVRLTALTRIIFQEYEKKIEENDTKVLRPQALMIR